MWGFQSPGAVYCKGPLEPIIFCLPLSSLSLACFPHGFIEWWCDGMTGSCNLHSLPLEGWMDDYMPQYGEMDGWEGAWIFRVDRQTLATHAWLIRLNVIHIKPKVSYQPSSDSCEIHLTVIHSQRASCCAALWTWTAVQWDYFKHKVQITFCVYMSCFIHYGGHVFATKYEYMDIIRLQWERESLCHFKGGTITAITVKLWLSHLVHLAPESWNSLHLKHKHLIKTSKQHKVIPTASSCSNSHSSNKAAKCLYNALVPYG